MKNNNELINPEDINSGDFKVKIVKKNSDLMERKKEKIFTEDGKEIL